MPRKNPLLFGRDEYKYLHKVLLETKSQSKYLKSIKTKNGMGLDPKEIEFVKRKFEEWKEENPSALVWMN